MDSDRCKEARNPSDRKILRGRQINLSKVSQLEVPTKINRQAQTKSTFQCFNENQSAKRDSRETLRLNSANTECKVNLESKNEKPLFSYLNQLIAAKKDNSNKSSFQFNSQLFGCGLTDKDKFTCLANGATLESSDYVEGMNLTEKSRNNHKFLEKQHSQSSSLEKNETLPPDSSINEDSSAPLNILLNDIVEVYCEQEGCYRKAKVIQIKQEQECNHNQSDLHICPFKSFYIHYLDYEKRMDNWVHSSQIHKVLQPFPDNNCNTVMSKSNSKNYFMQGQEVASIFNQSNSQMSIMLTRKRSNLPSYVTHIY